MEREEFQQFIESEGRKIQSFCRYTADPMEAEELYQDTLLTLWKKSKKLRKEENIGSYAYSVVEFLWRNKKRKEANRQRIMPIKSLEQHQEEYGDTAIKEHSYSAEEWILSEEQRKEVRGCVQGLQEKYRVVIYLYYVKDKKIEEIAKELMLPTGTVKTRLKRAKKILKERLEGLGYDR